MSRNINLSGEIEKQLPAELVDFMKMAGEVANSQGVGLYLVGGVVRDLLLNQTNVDLDLAVEGNAMELAKELAEVKGGALVTHSRFNTAKIKWDSWNIDLATARSETYARPGALPTVKPGSIKDDLFRRDFTINAMALCLTPGRYGELIDLYGGISDLEKKLVRVLHEKSFIDDATRIWRAIRYEQRFDFSIEPVTLELLKRGIGMLDTLSGDRIRHELELALKEKCPEKVLRRADELGVLSKLHPSLKAGEWLSEKYRQAREESHPAAPPAGLYLALLIYRLKEEEIEQLVSCLRFTKVISQVMRDTNSLKAKLESLANPGLAPSSIYSLLHDYCLPAIIASSLATDSSVARKHIQTFLTKLRYVKPSLTGNDLQRMGIAPGPRMKEILQRLHQAKLDGKVTSKKEEEKLVRGWVVTET